jgi:O-antigen/teichoic acid export membrane protein
MRRLVANSTSGLLAYCVNFAVQVWLYQYLIKRISPAEYSLYPIVVALLVFVSPLMAILAAGLARDTVEAYTRNDHLRVTEITSTMFPVLLAAGSVLALCGVVAAKYLGFLLRIAPEDMSEARLMVLLLFLSVSVRLGLTPFGVGLYVRQKFVLSNALNALQTLTRSILLVALLLGAGPRVLWVVVASVGSDLVFLFAQVAISVRVLPSLRFRFDCIRWQLLPGLINFGFWSMIGCIGAMIRKSSDVLVLNRFATAVDVDTFQLASMTDNQIDSALIKLVEPLEPHMVALHTSGGPAALQGIFTRGCRYILWLTLLAATPLIVFRHQLWSLYLGSKLEVYPAVPLVMVLLLARYWTDMPICLIGQVAYAMNRMRTLALLTIASSVSNLAVTIYFVHSLQMGAVGSALGTLISAMIWSVCVMWAFSLRLLQLKFSPWFRAVLWRGVLPSAVAGFFALGWQHWIKPDNIPSLLLAGILTTSIYVISILLLCLDDKEDRQLKRLFADGITSGLWNWMSRAQVGD